MIGFYSSNEWNNFSTDVKNNANSNNFCHVTRLRLTLLSLYNKYTQNENSLQWLSTEEIKKSNSNYAAAKIQKITMLKNGS